MSGKQATGFPAVGVLAIRADASVERGIGHVMRCFALADAWQASGGEAVFLSHEMPDALSEMLSKSNIKIYSLTDPDSSTGNILDWLLRNKPGWLVFDGYQFEYDEIELLARAGSWRTMVIEDWPTNDSVARSADVDVLLDQNVYANQSIYSGAATELLLGSSYALLRKEFGEGSEVRIPGAQVSNLLIMFGGSDPANLTARAIEALNQNVSDHVNQDLTVDVIVGALNQNLEEIQQLAENSPFQVTLHQQCYEVSRLMKQADLAISAAGSTCHELAACQVPFIAVPVADNQEPVAAGFAELGIARVCRYSRNQNNCEFVERLQNQLQDLFEDYPLRCRMSRLAGQLIDGQGANLVVQKLMEFKKCRPIQNSKTRAVRAKAAQAGDPL